jgi:polar amino acid transport system substrate-binding protein
MAIVTTARSRVTGTAGAVIAASMLLTACGGASGATAPSGAAASTAGDPSTDKLAQVLARGTLVLSTDPAYAPQSWQVKDAPRATSTKCSATQLTANQVSGYDVDTGKAVAKVLGVEPCFVTPNWDQIVSGNWGDRWDVAWGSGAINGDRMTRLWMTQPYESEPSRFFVLASSPYQKAAQLDGKAIGACTGCTHELYLRHNLVLPGITFTYQVTDPKVVTYDVETGGLKAVSDGKLAAFLCAEAVGRAAIASGLKLRALDPPAFTSMLTGFVDKKSGLADGPFVSRINQIIAGLHANGTLSALSVKYFGVDYAKAAGAFPLSSIGQNVS